MAQNGFGVYVGLHVRKDSAAIAAFNREVEQAVANAGKIDIGKALSAASVDTLTLGNDIQKKLDRFNFRIRIQRFDADGAIANLRSQIESMIGGINVNAVGRGGGGGSGAGNESSEASLTRQRDLLTDIVRLRTQAESALNRNILGDTGTTGVRLTEIITDLQSLQGQVSTTAEMSESEIANINSLFSELRLRLAGVSEDIVVSGENGDAAAQAYNRQLNLLNQIATKRKQINSILNSNTNIAGTALDTDLRRSLVTLDELEIKIQNMPYITRTAKDQFTSQINEVRNDISTIQGEMVRTGQTGNTMFTRLTNGFKKFGGWMVVTRVLTTIIRLCRQIVTNVKEIDSAMGQLRIVTNATNEAMESFAEKTAETSKRTGASIQDLTDSATTYARLGYSLEESSILSEYTSMLSKVADIDVKDAQSAITSITKAYSDIDIDNIEQVMDKLVKVGNSFPISTAEIAEGMNNASSALASAGNTFEQSVALLTAANTTVQDISKASTGLRTITARLRNTTVDLEELGEDMTEAKYEELISTLTNAGVALRDINGEYRSTYEIFYDLAAKWDSLSSMTQSALATNISGNRMQNVFYSLINQFKEAQGAMEAMGNSAGTLDQSFGKYLDTIVGHTERLSAAFGSFSQTILNSSTAKTLIDIASGLVTVLETLSKIHMLLPLIIASVTIWRGLKSVQSVSQLSSNLILHKTVTEQDIAAVNGLTSAEQMLLSQQIALAVESGILSEEQGEQLLIQLGLNGATSAGIGVTNGLSVSLRGLWTVIKSNPLGLILTVVTLIISAFQILSDKAEQARQETIQANQDIINSNREALDKYNTFATNANIIEKYLNATQLTTEQETKLQTAVDDVSKALGGKKIALSNTKQEQQEYLSLLQETAKEEKDAAVREARKSAQAARDTFKMKATESTSWTGTFLKSDVQDPKAIGEVFFNDAQDEISRLWRNAYDTGLVKTVSAQGDMATGFSIADDKRDDIDALLEYYELLLKIQNIYVDNKDTESDSYAAVTTAISQMKDAANDAYESMARLALLENPPDESIGSYDEYKQYVDDLLATSSQFADKSPEFIDAVRQQMYALGSGYPDAVQNANDAIETTTTTLAELKTKLSDISKEIDNIQSAYDTVKDLIDDYSENGYLSLDNLQSLLELEPEYLNLLIDENGQLNLNAQSYEDLAKAKLEDLLLSQIKATYAQILEMGVEKAAAYAAAQAYDTETSSLYALIEAQTQEALLQASIKDKDNNTTAYTDAVKRYTNTIPTLVGLVENYSFAAENATSETDSLTDALNDQKDALEDEKEALEDAKGALEEYKDELTDAQDKIQNLIDLVVDYLKKQKEAERDVLEERKEAFDDLIEKEKEELATKKEAAEFEEKLRSKQNAVAKDALAASIAGLDDSSAGKKAKKAADDALIESRADLYSTLADHEYDLRVNALDAIKEKQDEYYDAEIQKIDDYLDNERQLYEDACREIENDTGDLYDRLWDYTYRYTTQTRAEFDYLWTSAQEAIERYGGAQVGVINIMEYLQSEIYSTEQQIDNLDGAIDLLDTKISNVSDEIDRLGNQSIQNLTDQINNLKSTLDGLGSNKWIFRWKDVYGNDQTKYSALEDQTAAIHDILNQLGWDIRGGSFVKQHMEHLAVGTYSARGGPTEVNEQGHEIRVLNKGDGILTAKITRNLSNLGSDPVSFLADAGKKLLSKIGSLGLFGKPVTNPTTTYAVSNGGDMPITITNHINGDVNPSTLKALEKAQKDITQNAINGMMKMTLGLRNSSRVR